MMHFGERLKTARLAKGWSQARLADELDVEPSAVSRWEKGGGIDAHRIPEIAAKLDRPADWFLMDSSLEERIADIESMLQKMPSASAIPSEDFAERESIILRVQKIVPTLNERELRAIDSMIDSFLALRPSRNESAG